MYPRMKTRITILAERRVTYEKPFRDSLRRFMVQSYSFRFHRSWATVRSNASGQFIAAISVMNAQGACFDCKAVYSEDLNKWFAQ